MLLSIVPPSPPAIGTRKQPMFFVKHDSGLTYTRNPGNFRQTPKSQSHMSVDNTITTPLLSTPYLATLFPPTNPHEMPDLHPPGISAQPHKPLAIPRPIRCYSFA